MAYEQLLSSLASSSSGSNYGNPSAISTPVSINVSPVGMNLGSILESMDLGGNPETGGYGVSLPSRLGYGLSADNPIDYNPANSVGIPRISTTSKILIVFAIVAGLIYFRKRG